MAAVIEKFSTLKPMPGQGKRVMKSKLLTALGATGVLLPFPQNPEHILERKILLENTFSPTGVPSTPTDAVTIDWVRRVIKNGGAMPSQSTINQLLTFELFLRNNNLLNQILHCNFMAPDSLIAALTPYIVGAGGVDPYVEHSAGTNNITINGWAFQNVGDPVLQQMFVPSLGLPSFLNAGLVFYGYQINDATANLQDWGAYTSGTGEGFYFENFNGSHYSQVGLILITVAGGAANGYYSCQRTNSTTFNMYFANSTNAHASVGSNAAAETGVLANLNFSMGCGMNTNNGTFSVPQNRTYSFFAVTTGLSAGDSANLFTAVQALRVGLGGGFR